MPPVLALLVGVGVAAAAAAGPAPARALQVQLDAAIRQRASLFTIPAGVYNFTTDSFNISGATNLRVAAAGVTLWFGANSRTFQPGVNISNCQGLHVSGLSINYYALTPSRSGHPGITYNLLNSSDVVSEDITIYKAPFFSVTAFNGGGGHVFRRFHMPNDTSVNPDNGRPTDPWPHQRDAFHFTDLRRGVVVEDCNISGFGDDFFNSHNTIMVSQFSNPDSSQRGNHKGSWDYLSCPPTQSAGGAQARVADEPADHQPPPAERAEGQGRARHPEQEHGIRYQLRA
jgi:hypothetical protein